MVNIAKLPFGWEEIRFYHMTLKVSFHGWIFFNSPGSECHAKTEIIINAIISYLCDQHNIQMDHSLRNLQVTYKH